MNITEQSKNLIVSEIEYVANKIQKSASAEEKVYYFSGIHGIIYRMFNLEFDADLLHIHFVLYQTHTAFLQRLTAITKGGETIIPLTEKHFERLLKLTKELGKKIKQKEEVGDTLRDFVILTYTTTGNGYYLLDKGIIKI